VLVGHGSHLSPHSSEPVFEHAARIRAAGLFDEVLEAFWKEEPSLRDAIDLAGGDDVYVVPVFLAEGYFTRQVLPRELGISGPVTHIGDRVVHYCPPVGAHPAMAEMILERATTPHLPDDRRRHAALVVIGHGTERDEASGDTVYRLVETLARKDVFGRVTCGFLDESPEIGAVLDAIDAPDVVLVPFFVAEGWHTRDTIPADLGLSGAVTHRRGQTIWYSPPVGTLPGMTDVIVAVARDAGAFGPSAGPGGGPAPIDVARAAFLDWVDSGEGERRFLQILIRVSANRYELRHVADAGRDHAELRRLTGARDLLEIVRTDGRGRYRPLRTFDDLAPGWFLPDLNADQFWEAISLGYPSAALHWHQLRTGTLRVLPYSAWSERQTGLYEVVRHLDAPTLAAAAHACCGRCLRSRLWRIDVDGATDDPADPRGHPPDEARVPCREPCTVFATTARQSARN
jgi:sirohydrochlorin cobaltochelatase